MKKTMIVSGFAMFLALAATAQTEVASIKQLRHEKKEERKEMRKTRNKEIDERAKEQFSSDFENVSNVSWRREGLIDVATFTKDGVTKSAYYDVNDKLIGTTEKKSYSDLPGRAQAHINKYYSAYTIGDVILFEDNEWNESDMILYGHQFADADNYFVELMKDGKKIILQCTLEGEVSYFEQMK